MKEGSGSGRDDNWRLHNLTRFERGLFFQRQEIAFFATSDETFGNGFQFFPASADLVGFFLGDLVVGGGSSDDGQQIGKFLNDFVGCGNEIRGVRLIDLRIQNEESTGALANPLNESAVLGAFEERVDTVQRVGASTAGRGVGGRWFGPLVNHGQGKAQFRSHLLGAALLEYFPQKFM